MKVRIDFDDKSFKEWNFAEVPSFEVDKVVKLLDCWFFKYYRKVSNYVYTSV